MPAPTRTLAQPAAPPPPDPQQAPLPLAEEPTALSEFPEELAPDAPTPEAQAADQSAQQLADVQERLRQLEIENSVLRVAREDRTAVAPSPTPAPSAAPTPPVTDVLDGLDKAALTARLRDDPLGVITDVANHVATRTAEKTRTEMSTQVTTQTLAARDEQAALAAFPDLQMDPTSRQPGNPEFYQRVQQTVNAWNQAAGHYTPGTIMAAAKAVAFDMMNEGKLTPRAAAPAPTTTPARLHVLPRPTPPNPGLGESGASPTAGIKDPADDLTPADRAKLVENAKRLGVDPKKAYQNYLARRRENPGYGSGR